MKYKVGFYGSFSTGHDQDKTAILEQIDTCVQKAKCEFYVTVLSDFQAWCAKQALVAPTNKLGRELKFYYNCQWQSDFAGKWQTNFVVFGQLRIKKNQSAFCSKRVFTICCFAS